MSMSGSFQQMRENFDSQFEAAGEDRYLYRCNQKHEPIPVTAEERERLVHQYIWRIRLILGGMMAVLAAFWGLIFWWMVTKGNKLPDAAMYVGTTAIAVVAIASLYWVRGSPA